MKAGIQVLGINELLGELEDIGERQTTNVMRSSTHALASSSAKEMKQSAPVLKEVVVVSKKGKKVRKKGVTKNAIKAQRRKPKNGKFISDVVITEGKKAKFDAWYWHFVEYGTLHNKPQNFVEPVKSKYRAKAPQNLKEEFQRRVVKKLQKAGK